jgi:outer membrane protein OmpU
MTNLKKVGLTALAGSLVAVSAHAGELSVSGGAKFTYTAKEQDNAAAAGNAANSSTNNNGNRFGMQKLMTFTGSGELDNGHSISLEHYVAATGSLSSSILTYDMGELGALSYQDTSGDLGIGKIDDLMPTADEEAWNGIDFTPEAVGTGMVGRVDSGTTGFNYRNTFGMATVNIGYSPSGSGASVDDGAVSGLASDATANSTPASESIAVQLAVMDGLQIFGGLGDRGNDSATTEYQDDHSTIGAVYSAGPISIGIQRSEIEDNDGDANNNDEEADMFGIAFAINDNLSVSYGYQETEVENTVTDQEVEGFSIGYSMGGMTIKAHTNEAENATTAAAQSEMKHTEIAVSFAF